MNLRGKMTSAFFILALMGCAAPASIPAATLTPVPPTSTSLSATLTTLTPTPNITIAPRETLAPTASPEPGLRTNGPYLVYVREAGDKQELVMMDADGLGRKAISLPKDSPGTLIQDLSPDGTWLAIYKTNTSIACDYLNWNKHPEDRWQMKAGDTLTLSLLNIKTSEIYELGSLLPPNFPENFEQNADNIWSSSARPDWITTKAELVRFLKSAFSCGIFSLAWSSNSRYLAYASALDGPSSDVYLYDTQSRTTTRLSSGPQEIFEINWSPDGKWVMHTAGYYVTMYTDFTVYAAAVDGSIVNKLSTNGTGGISGWLDGHSYIEYTGENGVGIFDLGAVDVTTGATRMLWGDTFERYAIDRENQKLVINGGPSKRDMLIGDRPLAWAIYQIDLRTGKGTKIVVCDPDWRVIALGVQSNRFILNTPTNLQFLTDDGSITNFEDVIGEYYPAISVSPNKQYWLLNFYVVRNGK